MKIPPPRQAGTGIETKAMARMKELNFFIHLLRFFSLSFLLSFDVLMITFMKNVLCLNKTIWLDPLEFVKTASTTKISQLINFLHHTHFAHLTISEPTRHHVAEGSQ